MDEPGQDQKVAYPRMRGKLVAGFESDYRLDQSRFVVGKCIWKCIDGLWQDDVVVSGKMMWW